MLQQKNNGQILILRPKNLIKIQTSNNLHIYFGVVTGYFTNQLLTEFRYYDDCTFL